MRKKKILWHSDPAGCPSGFGSHTKDILTYLWKTGKFEIANYACGSPTNDRSFLKFPWKSYGTLPMDRPDIIQRANQDQNFGRMLSYGPPMVDEVIKDFKPDIYIGVQDFWAFNGELDSKWWNKIHSILHWTADSVPLLDDAVNNADKIHHHYVWAQFAETEFKRLADELELKLDKLNDTEKKEAVKKIEAWRRVKTIPGAMNDRSFYRLPDYQRKELRERYGFDKDTFIVSSGSRSQIRKLLPSQLAGFAQFQRQNPAAKTKFIFFTDVNEGWNLEKHIKENNLDTNDILFAYRCRLTSEVFYLPERKGDFDNPKIKEKGTVRCIGMGNFASESIINEFLNLSDCFILCATSGGSEKWPFQAKLTEIPVLINSYSCFEEQVGIDKGTLTIDENYTYEIGTGFKKAAVFSSSIAKQLKKVYDMDEKKRREIGKAGRDFVLKGYGIEVVAKQYEKLFDSLPLFEGDWDKMFQEKPANPHAQIQNIEDSKLFIESLYEKILTWEPNQIKDSPDVTHWVNQLNQGMPREQVVQVFRNAAMEHDKKIVTEISPEKYLRDLGVTENAVLLVFKESAGDCLLLTSILPSLRLQYLSNQLVVSCEPKYMDIFAGNQNIDLVIPFQDFMDNQMLLQGCGNSKALVAKSLHPRNGTQKFIDYLGNDNLAINLKD